MSVSIGSVFGHFTVVAGPVRKGRKAHWHCRCDCGSDPRLVQETHLKTGRSQSCGCTRIRVSHGYASRTARRREYQAWAGAKARCFNPRNRQYGNYGGRGISMCHRWRGSFGAFIADMGECPEGLTLERKNTNGNYEPGNCVWATVREQIRNRRCSILVDDAGSKITLYEFARKNGLSYNALHHLVHRRGIDPVVAISTLAARGQNVS